MSTSPSINCSRHGVQPETFVCQHIVQSLRTRVSVGFFWPADASEPRPDAWCSECETRVAQTGGEWIGEAAAGLGAAVLCASCYDEAKALNFGSSEASDV
jgi:hypothetical protein